MRLTCAFGRCQIDGARRTALLVPARAPGVTVQAIRSGVTGECTHTRATTSDVTVTAELRAWWTQRGLLP